MNNTKLIRLIEEMSEAIHIACKIDRFGWFDVNPNNSDQINNMAHLQREMDDVFNAYTELEKQIILIKHQYHITSQST